MEQCELENLVDEFARNLNMYRIIEIEIPSFLSKIITSNYVLYAVYRRT